MVIILIMFFQTVVWAESLRICQIDTSRLLLNRKVRLSISVTDEDGMAVKNLSEDYFRIYDMANNSAKPGSGEKSKFKPIAPIDDFRVGANYEEGVYYLLMLDNSGSMYWTLNGNKT